MAILFILVIFPLKFPLKPKKSTDMGRKGRRAKTKTVLENLEASGKTWEHAKLDILKKVK